jgi:hypothetical protein
MIKRLNDYNETIIMEHRALLQISNQLNLKRQKTYEYLNVTFF